VSDMHASEDQEWLVLRTDRSPALLHLHSLQPDLPELAGYSGGRRKTCFDMQLAVLAVAVYGIRSTV